MDGGEGIIPAHKKVMKGKISYTDTKEEEREDFIPACKQGIQVKISYQQTDSYWKGIFDTSTQTGNGREYSIPVSREIRTHEIRTS